MVEEAGARPKSVDTVVVDRSTADDELPSVRPSMSLGRYFILEEIGRGGMGRVWRAYDPKLQREVAIKEVRYLGGRSSRHLVAEARAMAKLSHPNVVAVFDVEQLEDDRVALVMEYVPGMTLGTWLEQGAPDWRRIVARFIEAGRGLAAAHSAGLLHRDFKPDNVLVGAPSSQETDLRARGSDDGLVAKVTDFGLAKVGAHETLEPEVTSWPGTDGPSPGDSVRSSTTTPGTVMGTPRYMAPEQHAGRDLTAAVDQYAFCVALWEALHGHPPFTGPKAATQKHAGAPAWTAPGVPRSIVDAIERGLAARPEDRWPTMGVLLSTLTRVPERKRRWTLGAVAVASAVAMAGGWSIREAQQSSIAATAVVDDENSVFVQRARAAAASGRWVYPSARAQHASGTALHWILELESSDSPAAQSSAQRLRTEFGSALVELGNRYWSVEGGRPFARDFYIQALLFDPTEEEASLRSGITPGELADLRHKAIALEFTNSELDALSPLTVLADPDEHSRNEQLLAAYATVREQAGGTRPSLSTLISALTGQELEPSTQCTSTPPPKPHGSDHPRVRRPKRRPAPPKPLSLASEARLDPIYTPDPDPTLLGTKLPENLDAKGGKVAVSFCVNPEGRITEVEVTQGWDPAIDELCANAVRRWRFQPWSETEVTEQICSVAEFELALDS